MNFISNPELAFGSFSFVSFIGFVANRRDI
jgi:hypothetical protein